MCWIFNDFYILCVFLNVGQGGPKHLDKSDSPKIWFPKDFNNFAYLWYISNNRINTIKGKKK